jgi:hypothetical protein
MSGVFANGTGRSHAWIGLAAALVVMVALGPSVITYGQLKSRIAAAESRAAAAESKALAAQTAGSEGANQRIAALEEELANVDERLAGVMNREAIESINNSADADLEYQVAQLRTCIANLIMHLDMDPDAFTLGLQGCP